MAKRLVNILGIVSILVGIVLAAGPLAIHAAFPHEGNPNPKVLPPKSVPYGMSYGEWEAKWWIWATEQAFATNQLFDEDGTFCTVGQSGPVWFLAGAFGGTWTRGCSVPPGKALFFPVANGLSFAPEFGDTEEEIKADVANDLTGISVLVASVDGVELQDLFSYRAASPAFVFPIPVGALLNEFGYPAGDRFPAVSDGWWLMLAPLPAGEHEIHFGAQGVDSDGNPFELDVTYNLTVEP